MSSEATPRLLSMATLAQLLWCLGYPNQALQLSCEAVCSARKLSHLHSLTYSMYCAIRLHLLRGEAREADGLTESALAVSTKHGFTLWTALIIFLHGWSLCQQGQVVDGVARCARVSRTPWPPGTKPCGHVLSPVSRGLWPDRPARGGLADARGCTGRNRGRRPALLRGGDAPVQGRTAPEGSKSGRRAGCCLFQRAVDVARRQQAELWEPRAATSLAPLWRDEGKQAEARDPLGPVYG